MNLPDLPEYVANYFNFIIDCVINPKKACAKYKSINGIDKDLLTYAVLGLFFSWLTISISKKFNGSYWEVQLLPSSDKIELETLTIITVPAVIFLSFLIHLFLKLLLKAQGVKLNINIKNTINGVLAFLSYAPFCLLLLFLLSALLNHNFNKFSESAWFSYLSISPFALFLIVCTFWYFPVNLIAMQTIDFDEDIVFVVGILDILALVVIWFR